jgi:chorismate synthase
MVGMDPAAVSRGANQLRGHGDAMGGHVQSVADLAALRAAFAGAGEEIWPQLEARLAELRGQLEAVQQGVTQNGTQLGTFGQGTAGLDQQHGTTMRGGVSE